MKRTILANAILIQLLSQALAVEVQTGHFSTPNEVELAAEQRQKTTQIIETQRKNIVLLEKATRLYKDCDKFSNSSRIEQAKFAECRLNAELEIREAYHQSRSNVAKLVDQLEKSADLRQAAVKKAMRDFEAEKQSYHKHQEKFNAAKAKVQKIKAKLDNTNELSEEQKDLALELVDALKHQNTLKKESKWFLGQLQIHAKNNKVLLAAYQNACRKLNRTKNRFQYRETELTQHIRHARTNNYQRSKAMSAEEEVGILNSINEIMAVSLENGIQLDHRDGIEVLSTPQNTSSIQTVKAEINDILTAVEDE